MTRTCSLDGCNDPHEARGLCNRHYLRAWNAGTLPPGALRPCVTCGDLFPSLHGAEYDTPECKAVMESRLACERKGAAGEWLTTANRMRALAVVAGLMERGYRRVPRRSPSRRLKSPHFSAWRVGKVFVIRWYDPTEQREEAAA